MPYVRVKDGDTGHELSVLESAVPHGNYKVLKEPAVDCADQPLPPKYAALKSSVESTSGHRAEPNKESTNG